MREDFTRKSQIYTGDMEKDIRTHPIHVVKWNETKWKNYIRYMDCLNAIAVSEVKGRTGK